MVKKNNPLKISILTLFPEMFQGPFDFSIVKKAREKKLVEINIINIRDFGIGKHKTVDDTPYGGGIGMIMRADVLYEAIKYAKNKYSVIPSEVEESHTTEGNKTGMGHEIPPRASLGQDDKLNEAVVLLSAGGKKYTQPKAIEFSKLDHLILICGHYEGVDERITKYIDEEISLGECVYTGGEIPAMLITDSITRLVPGVLKPGATDNESFSLVNTQGEVCLEYPHYTKPPVFENVSVPEVLLSGDHKKIQTWRMEEARKKTKKFRPDLLKTKKG